jgi:hypothetical protein
MMRITVSRAKEFLRLARAIRRVVARPLTLAVLTLGFTAGQSAIADCEPRRVPTIDSSSPTVASLRLSDRADTDRTQERSDQAAASATAASGYLINRLGIMYARGRGVPKSSRLATGLFRQVAMDGYTPAMVNLGTLYESGMTGRRSHRQAYAWIRAALALGVPKEDYDATLFKLGMIAARLGVARTTSAERLALTIIDRIGERCERSLNPYEDILALGAGR